MYLLVLLYIILLLIQTRKKYVTQMGKKHTQRVGSIRLILSLLHHIDIIHNSADVCSLYLRACEHRNTNIFIVIYIFLFPIDSSDYVGKFRINKTFTAGTDNILYSIHLTTYACEQYNMNRTQLYATTKQLYSIITVTYT